MEVRFVFFGSSSFSIYVLDALESANLSPVTIVTLPDKLQGRRMVLTPNPVKVWSEERNIKVIEVNSFKDEDAVHKLQEIRADVFVVASFGKIIPEEIIYLPKGKTLNVHPSLLPRLRGPAPIQDAIINEGGTGVTIMRLDKEMDHGPIVAQKKVDFIKWPIKYSEVEKILGTEGGLLLVEILEKWVNEEIEEKPQDESLATYTKKISKEDGDITQNTPEVALLKILAYEVWPRTYIFYKRKDNRQERVVVVSAHLDNEGGLVPDRVIPEGKREMSWQEFLRGNR